MMGTKADWLRFTEAAQDLSMPVCPLCGIHHMTANAHPYCDMAAVFKFWLAVSRSDGPIRRRRRSRMRASR